MKFTKGSDRIPWRLIDSVFKGEVTFLCGAGVSQLANLPLFGRLVERIYDALGENKFDDEVERNSFENGEYDRTLGLLEKRIRASGCQSKIPGIVSDILMYKEKMDLGRHIALLNLSRHSSGQIRLSTTNFDNLFEHAADKLNEHCQSHVLSTMPSPGSAYDFGIFHLHGRIADKKLGLLESELILTSADFGNAYLRESWVSNYIEDRIRVGPLILVGYGADDVAMRMLLEAIDADRIRLKDLNKIYALDKREIKKPGKKVIDMKSLWDSKGIKLIGFDDYCDIYATLEKWSNYNLNPSKYIDNELSKILL